MEIRTEVVCAGSAFSRHVGTEIDASLGFLAKHMIAGAKGSVFIYFDGEYDEVNRYVDAINELRLDPRGGIAVWLSISEAINSLVAAVKELGAREAFKCSGQDEDGKLTGCCNIPRISDLTDGIGSIRHWYCHSCGAHKRLGKVWTAREWREQMEKD